MNAAEQMLFSLTIEQMRELIREEIRAAQPPRKAERELLMLNDVAELLGLSRKTISRLVKTEGLPCIPYGRVNRFDRDAVLAWSDSRRKKP